MKNQLLPLLFLAFIAIRCQPDDPIQPIDYPEPVIEFKGQLIVTVKNGLGFPVKGVALDLGGQPGQTDEEGLYYFHNVDLGKTNFLRANKPGYFAASRRFNASADVMHYVDIVMMPLTSVANFSSANGALVNVDTETTLRFPANALMDKNGSPYAGEVTVFASPIYPNNPNLSAVMPGNLEGINTNNELGALITFGMVNVELMDENGDELQVRAGEKVEISLQVPANIRANAPPAIPTWYFDEVLGYWKEEGEAILVGEQYVFQVSHFTVWNCDDWERATDFRLEVRYADDSASPAIGAEVCFTLVDRGMRACEKTDSKGIVTANLPQEEVVAVEVLDPCGTSVLSNGFGPFTTRNASGQVSIPMTSINNTQVTGLAMTCGDIPIRHGYVRCGVGEEFFTIPITSTDGSYSANFMTCPPSPLTLRVFDHDNNKLSNIFSYAPGAEINAGAISACEEIDEFIRFTVQGFEPDYVYYFPRIDLNEVWPGEYRITIQAGDENEQYKSVSLEFQGKVGEEYFKLAIAEEVLLPNGETGHIFGVTVQMTEIGGPGEYVRGNFNGRITAGDNGAGGPEYSDFSGTFSVIRN